MTSGRGPREVGRADLHGAVVAVTGGARGIGRATAAAFLRVGARVAIGDIDRDLARTTAAELGGAAVALPLDVTERPSFERFADEVETQLGPLSVLVNNAGIMPVGPFLQEDDATTRRILEINCVGVLNGMKVVLPRFIERGAGHLVNVASVAGKGGFPGVVTYCGSKHFVVGVTEAARQELRGAGVELSCVMPNLVNTELGSGIRPARFMRLVEPDDVSAAIVEAVARRRFDVFVPRSLGPLNTVTNLLPRRTREGLMRLFRADQVMVGIDVEARTAYDLRVRGAAAPENAPGSQAAEERSAAR